MSSLRNTYNRIIGRKPYRILRLTSDGTPTGSHAANVNGSVTPVVFFAQPGPGTTIEVQNIGIRVSKTTNSELGDYGSISALSNGIIFKITHDGVTRPLEAIPATIRNNEELINLSPTINAVGYRNNVIVEYYNITLFSVSCDTDLVLNGSTLDSLSVTIRDDLTALAEHAFTINCALI
jgi:hypothetical protein